MEFGHITLEAVGREVQNQKVTQELERFVVSQRVMVQEAGCQDGGAGPVKASEGPLRPEPPAGCPESLSLGLASVAPSLPLGLLEGCERG